MTTIDEDLASFKAALVLDYVTDDDNQLIKDYITTAQSYVQNAVDPTSDLTSYPQYRFAYLMLAESWYLNRDVDMNKTPYQVRSCIQQLRGFIGVKP
ncbi:head-tail connector protein [Limosilactobacillus mucosae]